MGIVQNKSDCLQLKRYLGGGLLGGFCILNQSLIAHAHHPFGGQTPSNLWEGLLSGMGHPVIGIDHLVFVIAMGLVAAILRQGWWFPLAFVGTALLGTGLHLQGWDLLVPEFFISTSVLIFGGLLTLKRSPNALLVLGLAAVAGLFHGYAYGEAIIGAEMTPIVAYLVGFSVIQIAIATLAYLGGRALNHPSLEQPALPLRFAGFAIGGMGLAFVSTVLLA